MPVPGRPFLVGGHHGHEDAVGGLLRHERAQQPPWPRKQVLVLNNQKVFDLEKKYQHGVLVEGQEAPVVGAMGRRGDAFGRRRLCPNFDSDELWRPLSHQVFFCWGSQGHGCDQREKRHVAFAHFLCLPLLQMCGMMGSWHETDILGHHFSFIVTADLKIGPSSEKKIAPGGSVTTSFL